MSEELKTIESMIEKTQVALDHCKPASLKESDINKAAKERSILQDKLVLLESEKQSEMARIEEAKALDASQRRELLLRNIMSNHEKCKENYNELNNKIEQAFEELFSLIHKRDGAYTAKSLGISSTEAMGVLSSVERRKLLDVLSRTKPNYDNYEADIGSAWSLAVEKSVPYESRLYTALKKFPEYPKHPAKIKPWWQRSVPNLCEEMLYPPVVSPDEQDVEE